MEGIYTTKEWEAAKRRTTRERRRTLFAILTVVLTFVFFA